MSIVSPTSEAALGGPATARTATGHVGAATAHPIIVDALGQETFDELMASLQTIVDGGAAAAEALHGCVRFDAIGVKADDITGRFAHEDDVTDPGPVPETVDVDKLRAATAKLQEVVGHADAVAGVIEGILGDASVVSRLREAVAAQDEEADLEAIKGALADMHPGDVAIAGSIGAVIEHISSASVDLPADFQDAVRHLEESLGAALQDLSKIIERLRDASIAAVDALS